MCWKQEELDCFREGSVRDGCDAQCVGLFDTLANQCESSGAFAGVPYQWSDDCQEWEDRGFFNYGAQGAKALMLSSKRHHLHRSPSSGAQASGFDLKAGIFSGAAGFAAAIAATVAY
jgi:hypothetical protein